MITDYMYASKSSTLHLLSMPMI